MQHRVWLCLSLLAIASATSLSAALPAEESVLKELAGTHPNCRLFGHFYAPVDLIQHKEVGSTSRDLPDDFLGPIQGQDLEEVLFDFGPLRAR